MLDYLCQAAIGEFFEQHLDNLEVEQQYRVKVIFQFLIFPKVIDEEIWIRQIFSIKVFSIDMIHYLLIHDLR